MDQRVSIFNNDTPVRLPAGITHSAQRDEREVLKHCITRCQLAPNERARIVEQAADLVSAIRDHARPGLMEVFLAEYGLSTEEGVALMCLAEALLRVPDAPSIDALIEDKIRPADWGQHLGHSSSSLVNASTWALMLTGQLLDNDQPGVTRQLRGMVKRLGEPVIRSAVSRAMREMGRQFVLGESIEAALKRAQSLEKRGYTYSYDMLGEAARSAAAAEQYFHAYQHAIEAIGKAAAHASATDNPGISVKLSALHPRYELAQRSRVLAELTPRVITLARAAARYGLGFNIDAEESDRLALSLEVAEQILRDPTLADWDGFGMVVQAYGQRASEAVDWLYHQAKALDRRLTLRLVKGAYWDTEIKRAQTLGVDGFPVFTRKAASDVNYLAVSRQLLGMTDRIYPQFATHNAHSVTAIQTMAQALSVPVSAYEFQRLHGMGERLHDIVRERHGTRCRIYAPVGEHRDLLAYLVRRLLENGANSSFVNQIVDETVPPEDVVACPFKALDAIQTTINPRLRAGPGLFLPDRRNARGFDLGDLADLDTIEVARRPFFAYQYTATPLLATASGTDARQRSTVANPANPNDTVGEVSNASQADAKNAIAGAQPWQADRAQRAAILERAAELYERDFGEILALVAREAGKNLADAVGELREAVDFLYYYANQSRTLDGEPRGCFACISPWNFPLAIFTGQIAAALAAGNAVIAKPAEQTPLTAAKAVALLLEAGVPRSALQFLPGDGGVVGQALSQDERVDGIAFTGSTDTARQIRSSMAREGKPGAPLIAETGGINAMIVDSTALHEQAVNDVIASAFQSAGQRCSALRCLYIQEEVYEDFLTMLLGALDELSLGDPWQLATDVGPLIDAQAVSKVSAYVDQAREQGQLIKQLTPPTSGHFVGPAVISVAGIEALDEEIFGPVLHVASYRSDQLDAVIDAINATGYGLTFGLHTRIDDRVQHVINRIHVGNIYVNRNQIGAIVGSQPFGGEGLSGTGPKAGGPHYINRFTINAQTSGRPQTLSMPGPTGESNRLYAVAKPPLLCLGPGADNVKAQIHHIERLGGLAVDASEQSLTDSLTRADSYSGVVWWGDHASARTIAKWLAQQPGPLLPLITQRPDPAHLFYERHVCVDVTAAGGNAELLATVQ